MMPLEALLDPHSNKPATIPGYGPLPVDVARNILITSKGRKWWRRLFTAPTGGNGQSGPIVGGDSARRCFEGWLAQLIKLHDRTCRDPFCGAPIRHIDHIIQHSDGGPTSYMNGRGACERCNYVREMPGWQITGINAGLVNKAHTMIITTPTGHHYLSRAPDPPEQPAIGPSHRSVIADGVIRHRFGFFQRSSSCPLPQTTSPADSQS